MKDIKWYLENDPKGLVGKKVLATQEFMDKSETSYHTAGKSYPILEVHPSDNNDYSECEVVLLDDENNMHDLNSLWWVDLQYCMLVVYSEDSVKTPKVKLPALSKIRKKAKDLRKLATELEKGIEEAKEMGLDVEYDGINISYSAPIENF